MTASWPRTRALIAVAFVVASGCSTTTAGTPAAGSSGPSATTAAFDPCTDISDSTLTSAGLDPTTKTPFSAGQDDAGGEVGCYWYADAGAQSPYTANIGTTTRSIEEYRANPAFTTTPESVGGRDAVNFVVSPSSNDCNLALSTSAGAVVVAIVPNGTTYTRDQACTDARRTAEAVVSLFP